jgi:hypothetical protein
MRYREHKARSIVTPWGYRAPIDLGIIRLIRLLYGAGVPS